MNSTECCPAPKGAAAQQSATAPCPESATIRLQRSLCKNANAGIAGGFLFFLGSFACPCPFCYIGSATLFISGVAGRVWPNSK